MSGSEGRRVKLPACVREDGAVADVEDEYAEGDKVLVAGPLK